VTRTRSPLQTMTRFASGTRTQSPSTFFIKSAPLSQSQAIADRFQFRGQSPISRERPEDFF
jgi:hypothetical protein